MILWNLDPPDEEDVSSPLPANLLGLANLLSMPSTLKQSFNLLFELFRSFRNAVKCSVKEDNVPIMQLPERAIYGDEYTLVSEGGSTPRGSTCPRVSRQMEVGVLGHT